MNLNKWEKLFFRCYNYLLMANYFDQGIFEGIELLNCNNTKDLAKVKNACRFFEKNMNKIVEYYDPVLCRANKLPDECVMYSWVATLFKIFAEDPPSPYQYRDFTTKELWNWYGQYCERTTEDYFVYAKHEMSTRSIKKKMLTKEDWIKIRQEDEVVKFVEGGVNANVPNILSPKALDLLFNNETEKEKEKQTVAKMGNDIDTIMNPDNQIEGDFE